MEKANSLIEAEDENVEQLTGAGASSGTVPSGVHDSGPRPRPMGLQSRSRGPVESGVFSGLASSALGNPVSGDQLVDSLQSALSAASRGEAGLGSLHRSVRDASLALTSLRHAHESLADELRVMYRGLNEVMSEKAAVERYAALLTQERDAALDAAEEARREAKREREFLVHEQDRFIRLLVEEHDAELQQLRRTFGGRSSAPPALLPEAAPSPSVAFRVSIGSVVEPGVVLEPAEPTEAAEAAEAAQMSDSSVTPVEPPTRYAPIEPAPPGEGRSRNVSPLPRAFPLPARDPEDSDTPTAAPIGRMQLSAAERPSPSGSSDDPSTQRGLGERRLNLADTLRSEVPPAPATEEERYRTYPPAPAVVDLASLAAEVEGNSERPPPIRRIGAMEPKLRIEPARLPTQLLDTLVSNTGEEPDGKR